MGVTDILEIDTEEVVLQLNGLQDIGLPLIGDGYGASDAVVLSYAKRSESVALSSIPEMYRQMTREIRGEKVVESAYDGQTTFVLGIVPVVEDSLALYVDFGRSSSQNSRNHSGLVVNSLSDSYYSSYGSHGRTPYTFRESYDKIPTDKFDANWASGEVNFVGDYKLTGGAVVCADYRHKGMKECHSLRDLAIRLAAANFGMSLSGITDSARDFLMQLERNATEQLYSIMRGEAGIDMFDQLKLVDETRQGDRIPRKGISLFM